MTAADAMGNVVATTQTINNLFGAKFLIPGLGTVPNNYMNLYDPRPGHALSLAPGKRVTTSMSPMMALRDGKLVYALGLPGGKRIFPSALQALVNLIDHGMSLQEAVEAPRVWTEGNALEVEAAVPDDVRAALTSLGHNVIAVPTVAGGMNAIQFHDDGSLIGRGLLARGRHADRSCRRAGARGCSLRSCLMTDIVPCAGAALPRSRSCATSARRSRAPPTPSHPTIAFGRIHAVGFEKLAHGIGRHQRRLRRRRGIRRPGDDHGLQQRDAGEFAVGVESPPRRKSQAPAPATIARSLPLPTCATDALTLLAAPPPPWFCGSAMPVSSTPDFAAPLLEAERLQSARAVNAQQREIVVLVLGDAIGIAVAGNRDREAAVGDLAVGNNRAVVADDNAGAVFDGLARRRPRDLRAGRKRIERARHRDHHRLDGVFGGLIVEDGEDADLVASECSAQIKFLQALHARQHEEIRLDHGVVDAAPGGSFFSRSASFAVVGLASLRRDS